MNDLCNSDHEWNIRTNIGPISFKILIDSAFFSHNTQQYIERHKHATYEFHFITKGSGVIFTDESTYDVISDSYYLVNAGVYHMQKWSDSAPVDRYSCRFEFDICNIICEDFSTDEIKNFVYALSNVRFFYSHKLSHIYPVISEIRSELLNRVPGYYTKVQYLFSLLFIEIIRDISVESRPDLKAAPVIYRKERISIIDNYFTINCDHKATIQDLCNLVHLSKSQLNRVVKNKYGMTFKQKHIEAQAEYIKKMLINTDLPIKTIAEKAGYTSESNFTGFFKHITDLSPKAYRKKYLLSPRDKP